VDSFSAAAGTVLTGLLPAVASCEAETVGDERKQSRASTMFSEEELRAATESAAAEGGEESGEEAPEEPAEAQRSTAPGDFDDDEYGKSLVVQESTGLMLALMPSIGGMSQNRLSAGLQVQIDKQVIPMLILSDELRRPSTSAVIQPSPEGRVIRLSGSHRLGALPMSVNAEGSFSLKNLYGGGLGAKFFGPDFLSTLQFKQNQSGKSWEFMYHQRVTPLITAGGTLNARVARFLPFPVPQELTPSLFATLTSRDREWCALGKWSKENDAVSLTVHRQVNKNLEISAKLSGSTATLESSLAVGTRMGIGYDPFLQGPATTLTANVASDMKVGLSLQHFGMSPIAPTQQQVTSINCTFDHRQREHTVGMQVQFAY